MSFSHTALTKYPLRGSAARASFAARHHRCWRPVMAFVAYPLIDFQGSYRPANVQRVGWAERLGQVIRLWQSRVSARRALALFDSRDLHDVGMSRWELE